MWYSRELQQSCSASWLVYIRDEVCTLDEFYLSLMCTKVNMYYVEVDHSLIATKLQYMSGGIQVIWLIEPGLRLTRGRCTKRAEKKPSCC